MTDINLGLVEQIESTLESTFKFLLGGHHCSACFATGTLITTPQGGVAVERLRIGDLVTTAQGPQPIVWIGHRRVDCLRSPDPHAARPVRIRAGAFADAIPQRDLLLSPDHAIAIDGRLIAAKLLVNGATIVEEPVEQVRYYNLEFAGHALIEAEGLTVESYLDTGNRDLFANAASAAGIVTARGAAAACAPACSDGEALAAARAALLARAETLGWTLVAAAPPRILAEGRIVAAEAAGEGQYRFRLPQGAAMIRILSGACTPAALDPACPDHRTLGVSITGIAFDGEALDVEGPAPGFGFYAAEREADRVWRWTDGDADLAVPAGARTLALGVGYAMPAFRRSPARVCAA